MLKTISILIALGIGSLIWMNIQQPARPFSSDTLPAHGLPMYQVHGGPRSQHPCLNRQRCLVLYVSPWCPACRSSKGFIPFVRQAIQEEQTAGFMVIVGRAWGDFNNGHNMAQAIGGDVYLDRHADYWNDLADSVDGVPAWVVFDSDGDILDVETGAPARHDIQTARRFLDSISVY